jgi:hypothetical protein
MFATLGAGKSFSNVVVPTTVNLLNRFENSTNGTVYTKAILDAGQFGNAADANGVWSIVPAGAQQPFVSTAQEISVPGLQVSGGGGNGDTGATRSMRTTWTNTGNGIDLQCDQFTFATQRAKVSVGFAGKFVGSSSFNFYNAFELTAANGDLLSLHIDDSPTIQVGAETNFGGTIGSLITITTGTWYWWTFLYDAAAVLGTMKVYTYPALGLLGTSSGLVSNSNVDHYRVGRTDAHGVFSAAEFYTDDVAVDFTGVYPLLPNP